jgi:Mg2+/Co2+ transporter CorB
MVRRLGIRFWVAVGLAIASGSLTLLTFFFPTWIELFFGIEPDRGSGTLEAALALLPLVTLVGLVVACMEWRRMRLLEAKKRELSPMR